VEQQGAERPSALTRGGNTDGFATRALICLAVPFMDLPFQLFRRCESAEAVRKGNRGAIAEDIMLTNGWAQASWKG